MTKQIIIDLARKYNCETHYQGTTSTMFVHGAYTGTFIEDVIKNHIEDLPMPLPFKLEETKVWPLPVGKFTTQKEIDTLVREVEPNPTDGEEDLPAQTFVNENVSFDENTRKEVSKEQREALDQYLISNPIDRTQKGCYNTAASTFEVSVDYVRDRYRKLRAKKLVEN